LDLIIEERQLEVYTQPVESQYQQCQIFNETESVGVTIKEKEEAIGFISVGSLL
jgi:hypothetical protein